MTKLNLRNNVLQRSKFEWLRPKTRSTHVLQTQRLDTVFNENSLVSSSKPIRKKLEVKIRTDAPETFKGVEKPPARKHIYIGRISAQHDMEAGRDYCNENWKGLLLIKKSRVKSQDIMLFTECLKWTI